MTPKAILTDIEGTTSSLSFVADVLFPYARARLADYCAAHPDEVAPILAEVQAITPGDPIVTLRGWIDADKKITPLKTLQGMIWEGGFTSGAFKGHVYADAVAALRRWHRQGRALYIFSSGSVAAQKLIFRHSEAGDLTPLLSGYFDTITGPKRAPESYGAIAGAIGLPVADILFLSDVAAETDAAKAAGMPALLIDRSGGPADIHTFEDITR